LLRSNPLLTLTLFLLLLCTVNNKLWSQEEETIASEPIETNDGPHPQDLYQESEQSPHTFDYNDWEKTIDGIDYSQSFRKNDDYDEDFSNTPGGEKQKKQDAETLGGNNPLWNWFVKILFGALGLGLLFFIIYSIIKGNLFYPSNKKIKAQPEFSIETIENNIHESDLDRYIREALAQENYTLAIRLYYLAIIKELSLNRIIKWCLPTGQRFPRGNPYFRTNLVWQWCFATDRFSTVATTFSRLGQASPAITKNRGLNDR